MTQIILTISILGSLLTIFGLGNYFYLIKKNKVPIKPILLIILLLAGISFNAYALYLGVSQEKIILIPLIFFACISFFLGSFFLWVLSLRKTPLGKLKIKVQDSILPFSTVTSEGSVYSSENLKGKRVLLKFYRGGWCPYCSSELKMFEEMKYALEKYGVSIVGISGDTVEEASLHKIRDGISYTLLSDPNLEIIRQYGVEHQKALGADTKKTFVIFGIPFPKSFKFKSMSIPTSILIDEKGIIKWIDQSEDYRLRASKEAIMKVITSTF